MFDALYIGATGMQAQQAHVDAIANNLTNANTPTYKKTRVSFTDLVVRAAQPTALSRPLETSQGTGAGVSARDGSQCVSAAPP